MLFKPLTLLCRIWAPRMTTSNVPDFAAMAGFRSSAASKSLSLQAALQSLVGAVCRTFEALDRFDLALVSHLVVCSV